MSTPPATPNQPATRDPQNLLPRTGVKIVSTPGTPFTIDAATISPGLNPQKDYLAVTLKSEQGTTIDLYRQLDDPTWFIKAMKTIDGHTDLPAYLGDIRLEDAHVFNPHLDKSLGQAINAETIIHPVIRPSNPTTTPAQENSNLVNDGPYEAILPGTVITASDTNTYQVKIATRSVHYPIYQAFGGQPEYNIAAILQRQDGITLQISK